MKIGKREQIVAISIGAALIIFLTHFFVFQPRALKFAEVERKYKDSVSQLTGGQVAPSPTYVKTYEAKTDEYGVQVTSAVAVLNLDVAKQYMSGREEAYEKRIEDTVEAMKRLVALRARLRSPALIFMDDIVQPSDRYKVQQGWDIPKELKAVGVEGALWDNVVKVEEQYVLLESIKGPMDTLQQRPRYNEYLSRLQINPAEVSKWFVFLGNQQVFFNDSKLAEELPRLQAATGAYAGGQLTILPNDYGAATLAMRAGSQQVSPYQLYYWTAASTFKFGPLVPMLKKLWVSELIWEKRDPNTPMTKKRLREILEIEFPKDESLLCLNKQLVSLADIAEMAEKNGVQDIYRVALLKPAGIGKAVHRIPGQTPTPTPSPTPGVGGMMPGMGVNFGGEGMGMPPGMAGPGMMMPGMMGPGMGMGMGMGMMGMATPTPEIDKIGSGTGIEMYFRATNPSMVKFLFDLSHQPRTYALDDLHITSQPDGKLDTSATVELVYILKDLL